MTVIFELMLEFFLTGLLAIGGGMATLPFLYDMGARKGWFTNADVLRMLAVSESTPGPIGVNMATYVGFIVLSNYGFWASALGGLVTTLSLIFPSVIIIIIVSKVLDRFKNAPIVASVFAVVRPASLGLIAASGLSILYSTLLYIPDNFNALSVFSLSDVMSLFNVKGLILGVLLFTAMRFFKKLHPIVFIAIAAAVGIVFKM